MLRRSALVLCACFLLSADSAEAATGGVPMRNPLGVSRGTAVVSLARGSVTVRARLARLPASIDTGTEQFQATIYKAYLASSVDPAMEIPLGSVYPSTRNEVLLRASLKGSVSRLGLDRVVIVAYSKDGLSSLDVLTGKIAAN